VTNDGLAVEMHKVATAHKDPGVLGVAERVDWTTHCCLLELNRRSGVGTAGGDLADHGRAPVADADTERAHQVRLNERETLISAGDEVKLRQRPPLPYSMPARQAVIVAASTSSGLARTV
jgi:hypothetical protein